jgi:hypothetical protein
VWTKNLIFSARDPLIFEHYFSQWRGRSSRRSEISEVKPLFRCSIEPKKKLNAISKDYSKVMRKHKEFASLVEIENQNVLPSLRVQRKTRVNFFRHCARRKTKLIIFSQHIESLRFCFSFSRFEVQAIFSNRWTRGGRKISNLKTDLLSRIAQLQLWFYLILKSWSILKFEIFLPPLVQRFEKKIHIRKPQTDNEKPNKKFQFPYQWFKNASVFLSSATKKN